MQELVDYVIRSRPESERTVIVQQFQNLLKQKGDEDPAEDDGKIYHRQLLLYILPEIKSLGDGSERGY